MSEDVLPLDGESSSTRSSSAALDADAHMPMPIPVPLHAAGKNPIQGKIDSPSPVRAVGLGTVENIGLGPAFTLQERAPQHPRSHPQPPQVVTVVDSPAGVVFPSSPLSSRTKRQASPTELVKADAMVMPRLLKRPSIKRRPRTPSDDDGDDGDDSSTGGVQLGALILSSPPPPSGSASR